ncbi:hypothetical protein TNCV_2477301 [Trichonephila clavipes]|nr:hypothetical protein TNCV_2477301 [Trichonephila clavipes]
MPLNHLCRFHNHLSQNRLCRFQKHLSQRNTCLDSRATCTDSPSPRACAVFRTYSRARHFGDEPHRWYLT